MYLLKFDEKIFEKYFSKDLKMEKHFKIANSNIN